MGSTSGLMNLNTCALLVFYKGRWQLKKEENAAGLRRACHPAADAWARCEGHHLYPEQFLCRLLPDFGKFLQVPSIWALRPRQNTPQQLQYG